MRAGLLCILVAVTGLGFRADVARPQRRAELSRTAGACLTPGLSTDERARVRAILDRLESNTEQLRRSLAVDVYVHVIWTGENDRLSGNVTDQMIADQIAALSGEFSGAGTTFTLRGTDRSINKAWFTMSRGSAEERAAKAALHQTGAATLNIYSADPQGLGAWASFPWNYGTEPGDDGIVVPYWTFPHALGASDVLGYRVVHETGHWLGLLHTFEGGCLGLGDEVSDTTPENAAAAGCPRFLYSCLMPDPDPVDNFMDYSDDTCMTRFTPGQVARIGSWLGCRVAGPGC